MSLYECRALSGLFRIGQRNGSWWVEHAGFAAGPYPSAQETLAKLRDGSTQLPGTFVKPPAQLFPASLEDWIRNPQVNARTE